MKLLSVIVKGKEFNVYATITDENNVLYTGTVNGIKFTASKFYDKVRSKVLNAVDLQSLGG